MEKKLTIDTRLVGVPWKKAYRHIGWRQTTNYAAATHDMNPRYLDDEREGGIMAPPMFAVTLGWRWDGESGTTSMSPIPRRHWTGMSIIRSTLNFINL